MDKTGLMANALQSKANATSGLAGTLGGLAGMAGSLYGNMSNTSQMSGLPSNFANPFINQPTFSGGNLSALPNTTVPTNIPTRF